MSSLFTQIGSLGVPDSSLIQQLSLTHGADDHAISVRQSDEDRLQVNANLQQDNVDVSSSAPLYVRSTNSASLATETKQDTMILSLGSKTRFEETLTAARRSQFNFKPTWGVTALRYSVGTVGTGATVAESHGEFKLQSGTDANGTVVLTTNQRGQYQAGSMGQVGIGVRVPLIPTGTAFCEWGYTDGNNGFLFGFDATGKYVAYVTGGVTTKTYQPAWNVDRLDGTGDSGQTLDLAEGHITQIDFTWYAYGDIEYCYYISNATTFKIERISFHRTKIDGSASIRDPNQPLTFRVGNGASNTTNLVMYIGGHQFSTLGGGGGEPQKRTVAEIVTNYTTVANVLWQPLIAIRKKAVLNARTNSVLTMLSDYSVASDGDLQIRVTVNGTTSAPVSWSTPTGWTASETAMETKVTVLGTVLAASADGNPTDYAFALSGGSGNSRTGGQGSAATRIAMGATQEFILWVRRLSASGVIVVKHGVLKWTEEW
jgi:hypothetical protein